MFVKWSCGCKGFIDNQKCWVINACDDDSYDSLSLSKRPMSDSRASITRRDDCDKLTEEEKNESVPKSHEPLPNEEVEEMLIEMARLMSDGYAFRRMQSLLNHQWQEIKK